MPLSSDPAKREAQLANLRRHPENLSRGGGRPFREGQAPNLRHGARTTRPQRSPEWSPAVREAVADLEEIVRADLHDDDGEVFTWARPSIEAVAVQRVACVRMERHVADLEARGDLAADVLVMQSKVADAYHRALDREALTLRSRLQALAHQARGDGLADVLAAGREAWRSRVDAETDATEDGGA